MDRKTKELIYVTVAIIVMCLVLVFALNVRRIGNLEGIKEMQTEAVERGFADWVVTNTQGDIMFKWKE